MHTYNYVKEFGEGVDRIFKEMKQAGLPDSEYNEVAFMLHATIRNSEVNHKNGNVNSYIGEVNGDNGEVNGGIVDVYYFIFSEKERLVYDTIKQNPNITRADMVKKLNISARTIDRIIKSLKDKRAIERIGSDKTGQWRIINKS